MKNLNSPWHEFNEFVACWAKTSGSDGTRCVVRPVPEREMLGRILFQRAAAAQAQRSFAAAPPAPFVYQKLFDLAPDTTTEFKKLPNASKHVTVENVGGHKFLKVDPEALRILSAQAFTDVSQYVLASLFLIDSCPSNR